MTDATLVIGGLALRLDGSTSVATVMALPGMRTFVLRTAATPRLHFEFDATPDMSAIRELHHFEVLDGAAECLFGVDADGVYHYRFGDSREVRFDPRRPDEAAITVMGNPCLLRFAMWLAYCMTGVAHGRLPIHSSVVICDGRAVMCLGESGTGKSTHTRLWLDNIPGTHLLNDDSPIMAVRREGPAEVYGSPWSGKTHCYRQEHYPVAALLRLEQKSENTIRPLSTLEAFAALQPSCPPAMAHDERCLDMVVRFVGHAIGGAPSYRLGCLPNAAAARLSHTTIYGNL